MARRKHSRNRLVLDIGTSAVRMCELTQTKTGFELTKYYHRPLGIDPSADDEARRAVLADTLKSLLKEAKARAKKVVMAVPGQSVFTRPRALPQVPEHKVTQIVRYEIQQQIPFPLDQIALDYHVLSQPESGGYQVLMAAIKVDIVERHLEVLRDIKRRISVVDVCPLAAYNWLKHSGEFSGGEGECVALLDLGASTTDIVIERDNQFQWNRPLSLGGNDITQAIADEFNMSFEEAERQKCERAFAPTGDPQRDGRAGEVVGRVLSRLVSEITRSFSYYRSQPGGGPVSRVVVTGGGACLRNIIPYLQRQLGMEVRIAQPLAGLTIAPSAQEVNEHPEQAAVVLGMALRCCGPVSIEVNLIPPRVVEAARRKERTCYWVLSAVAVVLITLSAIRSNAEKHKAVLQDIKSLEGVITKYDDSPEMASMMRTRNVGSTTNSPAQARLVEAQREVTQLKEMVDKLDAAYRGSIPWFVHLDAVNEARLRAVEEMRLAVPRGTYVGIWTYSVESSTIMRDEAASEALRRETGDRTLTAALSPGFAGMGTAYNFTRGASSASAGRNRRSGGGMAPRGSASPLSGSRPNALVVRGYATTPECVTMLRDKLRESGAFLDGGVYLDQENVFLVNQSAVYATGQGGPARGPQYGVGQIVEFRIDVQFAGEVVSRLVSGRQIQSAEEDEDEEDR